MFNLSLRDDWSTTTKFCVNIAGKQPQNSLAPPLPISKPNQQLPILTSNNISANDSEPSNSKDQTRRLSECDSDYWDGDGRRLSECDGDWDDWPTKMISDITPEDDIKNKIANEGDDQFYEDMDKRYNENRLLLNGLDKVN